MIADPPKDLESTRASLPENVRALFQKKFSLLEAEMSPSSEGWAVGYENKGFKIYTKKDPVFIIQKSSVIIALPLEKVVPYLQNMELREKFDNLYENHEILKKITDNCFLVRYQMKGKFMIVSSRDFVMYRVNGYIDKDVD